MTNPTVPSPWQKCGPKLIRTVCKYYSEILKFTKSKMTCPFAEISFIVKVVFRMRIVVANSRYWPSLAMSVTVKVT